MTIFSKNYGSSRVVWIERQLPRKNRVVYTLNTKRRGESVPDWSIDLVDLLSALRCAGVVSQESIESDDFYSDRLCGAEASAVKLYLERRARGA
jgi:hypothetical protein